MRAEVCSEKDYQGGEKALKWDAIKEQDSSTSNSKMLPSLPMKYMFCCFRQVDVNYENQMIVTYTHLLHTSNETCFLSPLVKSWSVKPKTRRVG